MSEANNLNTKNDITLNSSNNSTHNDSIAILKKNISSLLKEKGMNQKALANAIGSTQPRVSKCLDLETKDCFTVYQLPLIAQFLQTSIDALFGFSLTRESSKPTKKDVTLADIAQKLFELDEMIELDFRTFSDNFTASIYFDNEPIHNLLKDWTALKALENSDSKKRVIEAWKNAMLEKMAERKDEYDFKTKSEAQIDLIETLVKEYRERSSYMGGLLEWDIQLTEKELDLLEDALSFLRLNSYERDVIERILEWNCRPLLPF